VARDALSGIYDRGEQELAGIGITLLNTTEITDAIGARTAA